MSRVQRQRQRQGQQQILRFTLDDKRAAFLRYALDDKRATIFASPKSTNYCRIIYSTQVIS